MISTISELNCDNVNNILREPFKLTKELFSSSSEFEFEKFVFDVNQYIQTNPTNKETISNILSIYSYVRPKKQELLKNIKKAISITQLSTNNNFQRAFQKKNIPYIFDIDIILPPIMEFIKNDDFDNLQFSQPLVIMQKLVK